MLSNLVPKGSTIWPNAIALVVLKPISAFVCSYKMGVLIAPVGGEAGTGTLRFSTSVDSPGAELSFLSSPVYWTKASGLAAMHVCIATNGLMQSEPCKSAVS